MNGKSEKCVWDGRREHYTGGAVLGAITIRLLAVNVGREKNSEGDKKSQIKKPPDLKIYYVCLGKLSKTFTFLRNPSVLGERGVPPKSVNPKSAKKCSKKCFLGEKRHIRPKILDFRP